MGTFRSMNEKKKKKKERISTDLSFKGWNMLRKTRVYKILDISKDSKYFLITEIYYIMYV